MFALPFSLEPWLVVPVAVDNGILVKVVYGTIVKLVDMMPSEVMVTTADSLELVIIVL